ncbi:hypothetical protein A2Z00_01355 [Candidatus Gottesmanbacteria bacterium RBG_13_45_10]|uniref:N-acetyltransferase domain-containing protein n=1 Tax=Candidatus Gottesmanbacteria bacterium RBG_13_45_10 TaxID=1798370 RepID=A0A1F5ZH69_9BACT|nr:MAG: hypothetical protein A2Z00_01355 [Candidatus Gottesmanbacteria bacterium RBG_13_45_10]
MINCIREYISTSDEEDLLICVKELREYLASYNPNRKKDISDEFYKDWIKKRVQEITLGKGAIFVAEEDGKITGYVYGLIKEQSEEDKSEFVLKRAGEVVDLFVSSKNRSKGIGKRLINEIKQFFVNNQCEDISLTVLFTNKLGISFYENQGFVVQVFEMSHGL